MINNNNNNNIVGMYVYSVTVVCQLGIPFIKLPVKFVYVPLTRCAVQY